MPTVSEWFDFFYPYLTDAENVRYVNPADVDMAIAAATDYRPACLTTDRQNMAQAHYAAYLLDFKWRTERASSSSSSSSQSTTTAGQIAGPIIEKREGDVSVKYATTSTTTSTAQAAQAATGPGTPYAAWNALWVICTPALAENEAPVRSGGIITRFGYP